MWTQNILISFIIQLSDLTRVEVANYCPGESEAAILTGPSIVVSELIQADYDKTIFNNNLNYMFGAKPLNEPMVIYICFIVNKTLRNTLLQNFNQNMRIFIE